MTTMSNPSSPSAAVRQRILDAALVLFGRHGYRRTSMADVAGQAGVSRASLYLYFADKNALFGSLAASVVDWALEAAAQAWHTPATLAENLQAAVLTKDLPLYRLLHASPHGAELLGVDGPATAEHAARLEAGFVAQLGERAAALEALGGADLSAFGGAAGLAEFVARTAAGLKHEYRDEAAYVASVGLLCRVVARAASPAA